MVESAETGLSGFCRHALVYEFWSFYCFNRDIMYLILTSCLKIVLNQL
jgi:hypothetical protein